MKTHIFIFVGNAMTGKSILGSYLDKNDVCVIDDVTTFPLSPTSNIIRFFEVVRGVKINQYKAVIFITNSENAAWHLRNRFVLLDYDVSVVTFVRGENYV